MAVMASSALDKIPLDIKATSLSPADAMALDAEANGAHGVLLSESDSHPSEGIAPPVATESPPVPIVNGNHSDATPAPAVESVPNVSSGIEGVAQFLPDSQTDVNAILDVPELGATTLSAAVEAPTSDARDEVVPAESAGILSATQTSTESTQQVPETQLSTALNHSAEKGLPDAMDVSQETLESDAPATSVDAAPTKPMTELSLQTQETSDTPSQPPAQPQGIVDQEMEDAPPSGKVRSREEDDEEEVPEAKRTKTETVEGSQVDFKVPELPVHAEQTNGNGIARPDAVGQSPIQNAVGAEQWSSTPLTPLQNKFLLERVRNTKKIKVASAFKDPVDYNALNLPTYPQIVTNPMDLSTIETKLKKEDYKVTVDFMVDLDQIVNNSVLFNGKDHLVTQAAYNMRAYFLKGMGKMPKADVDELVKAKPKKPTVAPVPKPRRESRAASNTAQSPTAPAPAAASTQTFPLNADGVPLIRRDSSSTNDRPKREIHRPPPKDLPYNHAKPKKKKYQQELKFCESVLTEIMKQKYSKFAYPFLSPVDPVALNIPSYWKIIKKPMDFGTINTNLKDGLYQNAKEFYNDAQLVFQNCYKFNPDGDEVHRMGKQLNNLFDSLWKEKGDWLAQHAPSADAQSPSYTYSDEEEDEEEEEEEVDPAQAQILAIQQQIAQLNETAQSLLAQQKTKRPSPKAPAKKKSGKPAKKKGPLAVPPPTKPTKSKPRTKAPAPLTFAQKQEISEGISTLGDAEMRRAVQIIRNGCPHLSDVNDDEMEIDMDEIGDDTLRELFKFIKQVRGPKTATVDDDFEPPRPSNKTGASKPKKNKPMGKKEQEDSIKKIQDQLRNFTEASGSGSSQSPPAHQDDSSDDESSGSESEEE